MKRFNKTVTKEAMPIVESITAKKEEIERLNEQISENRDTYWKMEGKYGKKKLDTDYIDYHYRTYTFVYESEEVEEKEKLERIAYYEENVNGLRVRQKEIKKEILALEEDLCVALWGFGTEEYYRRRRG